MTIADEHEPVPFPDEAAHLATTLAASVELDPIDPTEPGVSDYTGPLVADLRLEDWSRSALVRIAQEICLEGHLLSLSFAAALQRRVAPDVAIDFTRRQFTGAAGVAADRIRAALGLGTGLDDLARVLELHPALLPRQYTGCTIELSDRLIVRVARTGPSARDGGWMSLLTPDHLEPLDAIVRAVDPTFRCDALDGDSDGDELRVEVVVDDVASPLAPDVELTRISTGAAFQFVDRGTPVEVRYSNR